MGRLTEIVHFLDSERVPSREWMRLHYRSFVPTFADERLRELYRQKREKMLADKGRKKMKKIFDS